MEVINTSKTLKALCKYYMEFLESDFKTRRAPKRRIDVREKVKRKIDNSNYNQLNEKYIKVFAKKFDNTRMLSVIKKGQYTLNLPDEIIEKLADFVYDFPNNIDDKLRKTQDEIKEKIRKQIEEEEEEYKKREMEKNKEAKIKKELKKKKNEIFEDKVSKILKKCSFIDEAKRDELLKGVKANKTRIKTHFRNYKVVDLYEDLFELWKNKQMFEKEEIYLYFYEIKYRKHSYPLFYIQVQLSLNDENDFEVEYNPVLLVNKKALKYVSQKYIKEKKKKMQLDLPDRQLYLSSFKNEDEFLARLQKILNEVTSFFSLDDYNIRDTTKAKVKNQYIEINNNTYFMLFDKSDEAIVNDYEGIIQMMNNQEDNRTIDILNKISGDFLFNNPKTFNLDIDNEFDNKPINKKINFDSPIPLNKEQLKILEAIKKTDCNNIVVQGPPGNGKSHTISAVIYDALLNDKSVLVLSDKTEALDVVESKITQLLDAVNIDDYIQNPILRLGKKENNYHKIFKTGNYNKIKNRYHAIKHTRNEIDQEINSVKNKVDKDLKDYINFEKKMDNKKIKYLLDYEDTYMEKWKSKIPEVEIIQNKNIETLMTFYKALNDYLGSLQEIKNSLNMTGNPFTLKELNALLRELEKYQSKLEGINKTFNNNKEKLFFRKDIDQQNISSLRETVEELTKLKKPVIGYIWEKITGSKNINKLNDLLEMNFANPASFDLIENRNLIEKELKIYEQIVRLNNNEKVVLDLFAGVRKDKLQNLINKLSTIIESLKSLRKLNSKIPLSFSAFKVDNDNIDSYEDSFLSKISLDEMNKLKRYLEYLSHVEAYEDINTDDYIDCRERLQNKLIVKMTNILDESVINFKENFQNDAKELKKIIRKKMKISKSYLDKLIKAFPCLIVNIRELGDYLPFEADLFDLVIIDEASQVSIAQAFPAIIRAKTVIVLGDDKQFSNVKTHNASKNINKAQFSKVKEVFIEEIRDLDVNERDILLNKLRNFNVKNSILNFMERIANYEALLKKHFRGYKEIIQYSNETFYNNSLQVMKIRGKSIQDVIQFHRVNPDEDISLLKNDNINKVEANYIVNEIKRLYNQNYQGTVGVITPFKDQQKLISNLIYNSNNFQDYQRELKLKVTVFVK